MTLEKTTKQLPVLEEKYILPTGKHHVSYSEISVWAACSFKHKLKYIDKIELDKPSIHTEFGHVIHNVLAAYILGAIKIDTETISKAQADFLEVCDKLKSVHGVEIQDKDRIEFHDSIPSLLSSVPGWLSKEFPGWQPVDAEYALYESIDGQNGKYLKGFIDAIIKLPPKIKKSVKKKKTATPMRLTELSGENKEEDNSIHWIIDHKTTGFGWRPEQKRDFLKQLQLILYKHYYCRIMKLDIKQVRCGFLLLKRQPRKSDGQHCELVTVSVGPKTEAKALRVLNDMVNQISCNRTIKNRNSCRWCEYSGTRFCP